MRLVSGQPLSKLRTSLGNNASGRRTGKFDSLSFVLIPVCLELAARELRNPEAAASKSS